MINTDMEIITSLKISELEQLITDSVQRCLNSTLHPAQPAQNDLIGINEACDITGWLKPTIYKKSFLGAIPCSRMGKRLVFSRKELTNWMQSQTIRKVSIEENAIKHLQKEATKRLK
jgi:predicted DNA-binding transcriptional regulator AlpA